MIKSTHDPEECIRNIFQLLVYKKKRIGFLFGAGTSKAQKIKGKSLSVPDIKDLTKIIEEEILKDSDKDGKLTNKYKDLIVSLKTDLSCNYNLETILSNLEQKHEFIGSNNINGLIKEDYHTLILKIKGIIKQKMSVHLLPEKIDYDSLIQSDFATWIGQADRTFGIEIFTTNYDYLFELGLEHKNIPYFDGYTGSYKPFFNTDAVDDLNYLQNQTKLWKIHGSLGWHTDEETGKIVRYEMPNDDIYINPSVYKYSDSKKQPYLSLLDRLSKFLNEDDTVLFTCGYSFNDFHINERLITSLNNDKNSHVIALYYDEYLEDEIKKYSLDTNSHIYNLAKSNGKLSVLGMKSAVIGRQLGKWKIQREPDKDLTPSINLFFDEDAPDDKKDEEIKKEFKGSDTYTGEGIFRLPDFVNFVNFLNSMVSENPLKKTMKDVIK